MKKLVVAVFCVLGLTLSASFALAADECKQQDKKCCQTKKAAASKDPTAQSVVVDPVCGMDVKVEGCKYCSEYKGKKYCFCSESCMKNFDKDPAKYIGKDSK